MRKTACAALLLVAMIAALAPSARAEVASRGAGRPSVRIADVELKEGDDGVTRAVFKVVLSRPALASVEFATTDGTADAGPDYTSSSGTLLFTPNKATKKVSIKVLGDTMDEPDETFTVKLSHSIDATISDKKALATISDDDGPSFSVVDATAKEGQNATFTVSLSASLADTATVDFATANGSATAPEDYQATTGTLTFEPGQSVQQVVVQLAGDSAPEVNENFGLNLSNATGAAVGDGVGIGTITDDDVPSVSIGNATVTEGNSGTVNAVFTLTLSAMSSLAVDVNYATANGTASAPADYQSTSGTVSFDPGETAQQVVVPVAGDSLSEVNETFGINVVSATGATILDGVGLGTITDDDTPTISVANAAVTEGNSGTTGAVFTVTLSFMSSQTVSLSYATADGSATAPADYQSTSGTVSFDPGETVQQIVVPVVGDVSIETAEAFSLNLSSPANATFADATAQGTITDNDTVTITIAAATVTEANAGTRDAVFNVSLSAPSGSTVTVDFATANGSATAPADYLATTGTVTFAPGEVSKQIVVQTVGDTAIEANETFSVNLSNPANATIAGSGFGLGTITNND
ncbi:MAG: Calx-beta domain-containing protein [Actinomycetota bacterium]